jgi:hypothetical protein
MALNFKKQDGTPLREWVDGNTRLVLNKFVLQGGSTHIGYVSAAAYPADNPASTGIGLSNTGAQTLAVTGSDVYTVSLTLITAENGYADLPFDAQMEWYNSAVFYKIDVDLISNTNSQVALQFYSHKGSWVPEEADTVPPGNGAPFLTFPVPVAVELPTTGAGAPVMVGSLAVGTVIADPRAAGGVTYNGDPLPAGSVLRNITDGQKFIAGGTSATDFTAIEITPPAAWGYSAGGEAAWEVLQDL